MGEFKLIGADKMAAELRRIEREMADDAAAGLFLEGELIMTESKQKHVPVDVGPLRASGHVEPPKTRGGEITVLLAFGGAAAPYALAVHEHPSRHSPPSWEGKAISDINWNIPGTGPKYLEIPLKAAIPGMAGRIAARVKPR